MNLSAQNQPYSENPIATKSFTFSLRIIEAYKALQSNREFILSRQLLKSGTSIGANIEEALGAFSKKEFAAKMSIAYKEARESEYWIRLLFASGYLSEKEMIALKQDVQELLRILGSILRTIRGESIHRSKT